MKSEIRKAENENCMELEDGYFPDVPAFDLAEYKILKRIKNYPEKFPWDPR